VALKETGWWGFGKLWALWAVFKKPVPPGERVEVHRLPVQ